PGSINQLLADGVISHMMTEPYGVWIWLAEHESWREHGAAIRTGLASACNQLDQWDIDRNADVVLDAIAHDIIDDELHAYIESHGGSIAVDNVSDGVVSVVLNGSCSHCNLANATLHLRLDSAIRRRYPRLVEVHDVTPNQAKQRFSLFRSR
ncbi:MAG: NifU family protein, partial [Propionibacteriaceae bacterium]